jgi:hypothetical protein
MRVVDQYDAQDFPALILGISGKAADFPGTVRVDFLKENQRVSCGSGLACSLKCHRVRQELAFLSFSIMRF